MLSDKEELEHDREILRQNNFYILPSKAKSPPKTYELAATTLITDGEGVTWAWKLHKFISLEKLGLTGYKYFRLQVPVAHVWSNNEVCR